MSRPLRAILFAVCGGAIGFAAGFYGPIVLTPEANQGPLLGIFITGPLGFFLGGLVGACLPRRHVR
jgi:energy-converting hydrogenase Eha subunit B